MFDKMKQDKKDSYQDDLRSQSLLSIPADTTFTGTIQSVHNMRLDGNVQGDITTSAKVVVGKTGFVQGNIRCKEALILGRIEGNIWVKELIEIREDANVKGDIMASQLAMDAGVKIEGYYKIPPSTQDEQQKK